MASNETFREIIGREFYNSEDDYDAAVCCAHAMARRAVEIARLRLFNGPTSTEYEAGYNAACGHIIADIAAFAGIEGDDEAAK